MIRQILIAIVAVLVIPVLTWWAWPRLPYRGTLDIPEPGGTSYAASLRKFERIPIEAETVGLPLMTNVQIHDLNRDGQADILACDSAASRLLLYTRDDAGVWNESTLIRDLEAPAHVTIADVDGDDDDDVIVSILGNLLPDDHVIGRVELYENDDGQYRRHVILDDVRRVADVQPGDFDGDGDVDLAVAVFGYSRGAVMWLENRGHLQFRDHELLNAPGTIHVPVADFDGDGDLDIAAIVSQDEEELWAFENQGAGRFQSRRIWMTPNFDLGSAGLVAADLDQDGDSDLILPVGDNLEDLDAYPQPYHGCLWFENQGDWQFVPQRIAELGGTYAADVGDLDRDGDQDVVLVSMTNDWQNPQSASIVWLENDGHQQFTTWQIDQEPIHLVTVAVDDLDGDSWPDIVAGGLNLRKPFQRMAGVTAWRNPGAEANVAHAKGSSSSADSPAPRKKIP